MAVRYVDPEKARFRGLWHRTSPTLARAGVPERGGLQPRVRHLQSRSARRAPAAGFGDTVRGRPGTTDVREMTPVLGDLRRGELDFAQTPRRVLILPIHPRRNPKDADARLLRDVG